ncbi:MAG: Gfo/Idh/MocA family oxidoreductase [Pirellulaceae bacterium]|nr:Gfo/Idh/MocA family oxidoreductase [Pirellulaceae bacterium]
MPASPISPVQPAISSPSRRLFLSSSSAAVLGGAVVGSLKAPAVHAEGSSAVKVGLIGCGGRGSQAAINAMRADPNNRLTVLADIFPDRLAIARQGLQTQLGQQCRVTDDTSFTGFDGYQQVVASDVDVVLLCTPPHFRPLHLKAAIDAGKHVFCEKPVAVDAPGVRSVLKTCAEAKAKKLAVVSGLCWRYDYGVRETIKRIQDGAIGDIVAIQENYLTGTLWHRGRKPEWSEMEYQIRNWLYYTWLSGDHNVEQHIHSLDKALWLMGDKPPLAAVGLGGRQVRTEAEWGNIYDHHAVAYEWENGVRVFAFTRQQAECAMETEDIVLGTKGQARVIKHEITSGGEKWRYRGEKPGMYDVEHAELFASIKAGNPINNGEYMSYSTLLAIMGRMATYTGQRITWEMAMNSQENLSPERYEWGDVKVAPVAMPGKTKFV